MSTKTDIDTILSFISALKTTSSGTTTSGMKEVKMYETDIIKKNSDPNATTYDTLWKAHNEYKDARNSEEKKKS